MVNLIIRSALLYIIVVLVMRLMGKRQIGELQPYELVISIMIAELAAIPMEDVGGPHIQGTDPDLHPGLSPRGAVPAGLEKPEDAPPDLRHPGHTDPGRKDPAA